MATTPDLQTTGGADFGDGTFQPNDMVTIHDVSNLEDGLRAKIIAYDPDKSLYVVKDSKGQIWGLRSEKLRAQRTLALDDVGGEWKLVPEGVVVPGGIEVTMDLQTGEKYARKMGSSAVMQVPPTLEPATARPERRLYMCTCALRTERAQYEAGVCDLCQSLWVPSAS